MHQEFERELRQSLYVHRPLPLHRERALEAAFPFKKVTGSTVLYNGAEAVARPAAPNEGSLTAEGGVITIRAPFRADRWPAGAPADGDYSNFGQATVRFDFAPQNWENRNRLRFYVRPLLQNAHVAHVNVSIRNEGAVPLPDPYFREGATVFDLENGKWNECIWEFAAMPRDAITQLSFYAFLSGHDIAGGEQLVYEYRDITLEQAEAPEHEHGWQRDDECINLSTVGYWPAGAKTAVGHVAAEQFALCDAATGQPVYTGCVQAVKNERGEFSVLDFSQYTQPGEYFLQAGGCQSPVFSIGEGLCEESLWRVVNFLYCERCGAPVPGKHGTCHEDILARHNGAALSFGGGWHDAGDVSQQSAQTAEVTQALFEAAGHCEKDSLLYLRLMEEAQWGLDFVLKTRFGDGYRASSAGATRFTDNLAGNFDDIEARVHNHSFENFLCAGVEAHAAAALKGYDDELAAGALQAAREDYGFAEEVFAQTGVDPFNMFEHTYNSGRSQYYAAAVWAASLLYTAGGDETYAAKARAWAEKLLACQETGGAGIPLHGFFYRDESHRTIVHFNHQSREHQFMQALDALCRSQPNAAELPRWEQAMRLYGEYLKAIAGNTAPYGMLPAGVHKLDEIEDTETFPYLHVACVYEQEKDNYRRQLAAGTPVAEGYVLRNFPVWFSFRGNTAVMLSMGKAASLLGNYFDDPELRQIGREQLYWMWGKNPFGQSLLYGAGSNYCRQYAVLCGECVGELPVGIETLGNEDVPYWPQNNNATFREVWTSAASHWLWVAADNL